MRELGKRLRGAAIFAALVLATGWAGQVQAEFKSALTRAQIDRIFDEQCQSEEATMRRDAAAAGTSYTRDGQFELSVFMEETPRKELEVALSQGRGMIENTSDPLNRTLYLLGHCVIEAKYNLALEREKPGSPPPAPAPFPTNTPRGSTAYASPFNPRPASATPSSYPGNGPIASEDEEDEEGPAPAPPATTQTKSMSNSGNFQGIGAPVTNAPPPPQVNVQGEPINSQGRRCFQPPVPDEEPVSTGMKYTFVFVNRCQDPIVVDLTYSANPLAADPTTNVTLYDKPLTWICTDQKIGGNDCTQGLVKMFARWR